MITNGVKKILGAIIVSCNAYNGCSMANRFLTYASTFKTFKKTSTWEWHHDVGLAPVSVITPFLGSKLFDLQRHLGGQGSRFHGFFWTNLHFSWDLHTALRLRLI